MAVRAAAADDDDDCDGVGAMRPPWRRVTDQVRAEVVAEPTTPVVVAEAAVAAARMEERMAAACPSWPRLPLLLPPPSPAGASDSAPAEAAAQATSVVVTHVVEAVDPTSVVRPTPSPNYSNNSLLSTLAINNLSSHQHQQIP